MSIVNTKESFVRTKSVLLLAILLVATSCHGASSEPQGHYEGTLLKSSAAGVAEEPVTMDVTYDDRGAGTILVKSEHASTLLSLVVPKIGVSGFSLGIAALLEPAVPLKAEAGQPGCFQNGDGTHPASVEFCVDSNQIYLEIANAQGQPTFTLSGNHFAVAQPFTLEAPATYALPALIRSSLQRNFASRIEYEHYIEVKDSAKAAWLNLLPHLSISSVLSNLPLSATGLLGAIADLVPFAIPSNWFHAKQATLQASAERDALILMQADLANEVEGLVYALARDEGVQAFYQDFYPKMQGALATTQQLSAAHQGFDSGSVLNLQAVLNAMDLDQEGLKLMIEADKTAIAQALGLHNPEGVIDVGLGPELVPIDQARALAPGDLEPIALARAFELQQMDRLIAIGQSQSKSVWFNWLDPMGDPTEELGPALGEEFAVSKEQVLELQTEREQTQQGIVLKVDEAVEQYNSALTSYAEANQGMQLETERWAYEMSQLVPNSGLNTMDIETIEQDWIAMEVRLQTIITGFRVARSNLDRLLLQGYYSDLQHEIAQD